MIRCAPWRARTVPLTAPSFNDLGADSGIFKRRFRWPLTLGILWDFLPDFGVIEKAETIVRLRLFFSVIAKITRLLFQAVPLISSSGQSIMTTSGTM